MSNSIPHLSFADLILRFKTDAGLAHDFVRGDATVDVIGEDGTYPSLAKLVSNIQTVIAGQSNLGFIAKTYTFSQALYWRVLHPDIISSNSTELITNSAGINVFAPKRVISNTEFIIDFTEPESGTLNVIYYI